MVRCCCKPHGGLIAFLFVVLGVTVAGNVSNATNTTTDAGVTTTNTSNATNRTTITTTTATTTTTTTTTAQPFFQVEIPAKPGAPYITSQDTFNLQIGGGVNLSSSVLRLKLGGSCDSTLPGLADSTARGPGSTGNLETSVLWGNLKVGGGGAYSVCWCLSSSVATVACDSTSDFQRLGLLLVVGPGGVPIFDLTNQGYGKSPDASLTVYDTFNMDLTGHNLPGTLQFMRGETCGGPLALLAERPKPSISTGTNYSTTTTTSSDPEYVASWTNLKLVGGVYSICWCCVNVTQTSDFSKLGNLEVVGPGGIFDGKGHPLMPGDVHSLSTPLADKAFDLQFQGFGFLHTDRIRVVEASVKCGESGASTNTAMLRGPLADNSDLSPTVPGPYLSAIQSVLEYWSIGVIYPAELRVCWCTTPSSYFTLYENISTNASLISTNASLSSTTVSTTTSEVHPVSNASNVSSTVSTATTTTTTTTTTPSNFTCVSDADFSFEAGRFGVGGPTEMKIDYYGGAPHLSIGQPFQLVVSGIGLNTHDRVRIVDAAVGCGTSESVSNSQYLRGPLASNSELAGSGPKLATSQVWSQLLLDRGGHYSVCWCSSRHNASNCRAGSGYRFTLRNFTGIENFSFVGLGSFEAKGPSALVEAPNGTRLCPYAGVPFHVQLQGYGLTATNRIRVVEARMSAIPCGDNALTINTPHLHGELSGQPVLQFPYTSGDPVGAFYNETWGPLVFDRGGWFTVCWCSGVLSDCQEGIDFAATIGEFNVSGPTQTTKIRRAGNQSFNLDVVGIGLKPGDRIRLVSADAPCGSPGNEVSAPGLRGPLADAGAAPLSSSVSQTWVSLSLASTGNYRICWCAHKGTYCAAGHDFSVDVGQVQISMAFFVRNTDGLELRPVVGVKFDLVVAGDLLSMDDRVRIVETSVTCGTAAALHNTDTLYSFSDVPYKLGEPDKSLLSIKGTSLEWPGKVLATGGPRRVCWCINGPFAGATQTCDKGAHFFVDVGILDVLEIRTAWVASYYNVDGSCLRPYRPFRAHVTALGLRPEMDRVLVARASDVCGEALPRGVSPAGDAGGFGMMKCEEDRAHAMDPNFGVGPHGLRKMICGDGVHSIVLGYPGVYRLCFCGRLPGIDCSSFTHYRVDAGSSFGIMGPTPVEALTSMVAAPKGAPHPWIIPGHDGVISSIAYANTTGMLATASEDNSIRLWDVSGPHQVAHYIGHASKVLSIAWSPNGTVLASGSADGTVRLWPSSTDHICPRWSREWIRGGFNITDAVWLNRILSLITGVQVGLMPVVPTFERRTADAGDLLDFPELTLQLIARQCEKACELYRDVASSFCDCGQSNECYILRNCIPKCGLEMKVWTGHESAISAVAYSPNGQWVVSASHDYTVRIWDALGLADEPLTVLRNHFGRVLCLAFSISGLLASGGDDADVVYTDVKDFLAGNKSAGNIHRFVVSGFPSMLVRALEVPHRKPILSMAFSPDGRLFAVGTIEGVMIFNVESRSRVRTLSSQDEGLSGDRLPTGIAGVSFSHDSRWLAMRTHDATRLWSVPRSVDTKETGEWALFTMNDVPNTKMTWYVRKGPSPNLPTYGLRPDHDGALALHFAPCKIAADCKDDLPVVRVDIEVPFEFTHVRGSFIERSTGAKNGADDCRGGLRHARWNDFESLEYWAPLAFGFAASGEDCPYTGHGQAEGRKTVESCQEACAREPSCNMINYRKEGPNCELRRCLDVTKANLIPRVNSEPWAFVRATDLDVLEAPRHDGYVLFGALGHGNESHAGREGVIYGGCDAGAEITSEGKKVTVIEVLVGKTRTLRFQVAQSRQGETLLIRDLQLHLYRPHAETRLIPTSLGSSAVTFSPKGGELAVNMGEHIALWDIRAAIFPQDVRFDFVLRQPFDLGFIMPRSTIADRIRVVDASVIANCGNAGTRESTRVLQGLPDDIQGIDNGTHIQWKNLILTSAGTYRVCYCGGRPHTCCELDTDFPEEIAQLRVPGAANDHYYVCDSRKLFDTGECRLPGFRGLGLKPGDMLMVQEAEACGEATGFVPGFPNDGVLQTRPFRVARMVNGKEVVYEDWEAGTWYRFEKDGKVPGTFDPDKPKPTKGKTWRLCWCPAMAKCDITNPADFLIEAGLITITTINSPADLTCETGKRCLLKIEVGGDSNNPIARSDAIIIRHPFVYDPTLPLESGLHCDKARADGFGPPARMSMNGTDHGTFDLGVISAAEGEYRLCWCQGSIRECVDESDFIIDIGKLSVSIPAYIWPNCNKKELAFVGWREWETFDDCCCNFAEAGAVGCTNSSSEEAAICNALPKVVEIAPSPPAP